MLKRCNKKFDNKFTSLALNIKYLDFLPKFQNEKYIVYHHRQKGNSWDTTIEQLSIFISNFSNYNIVVFSGDMKNFEDISVQFKENQKIYFTSNLQEYATFMHSENCEAIISVWSGGGQLALYCANHAKIIMFFDKIQLPVINDAINDFINYENAFDLVHFTKSKRYFYVIIMILNK